MTDAMIRVRHLRKAFGDRVVLDGVDLTVAPGTVHGVLGPNGAGKTTLIRILATLARPGGGSATVAGHDVVAEPQAVRRAISLTGQYAAVDDLLTGAENLRMIGRLTGLDARRARVRADELLASFDLVDARDRRVATWSGGMRRRLDLAASLVSSVPVLFLDEPTTGLDARSRQALWSVVDGLRDAGTTVLLTTQHLEEADRLADRISVVDRGRVVAEGTADELKSRVGSEVVELTLARPADLAAARALVATGSTDRDTGWGERGDDGGGADAPTLRVPTDGSADHLRRLLDGMAAAGVDVVRVGLRRPTLDDVFLAVTRPGAPVAAPHRPVGAPS